MEIKSYKLFLESAKKNEVEKIYEMLYSKCRPFIEILKDCNDESLFYRGVKFRNTESDKLKEDKYLKCKHNWDRIPMDTPENIHNLFNNCFEDLFGWPGRSGVFATKDVHVASSYSSIKPTLLFPIGEFDYIWSPEVEDFFRELEDQDMLFDYDSYVDMETDNWHCDYSEGAYYGQWIYKDGEIETGTSDIRDAIDKIKKILKNDEIDINKDDFYWEPEVSLDVYVKSEYEFNDERDIKIDRLLNYYTDTDICNSVREEVSFKCDEYYLVDKEYADVLIELIWGKPSKS